jgi:cell division protein FtsW
MGIGIQASELARIGLVLVLSRQLSIMAVDGSIKDPFGFSVVMTEIAIIVVLIAKEPDLSSSMLVAALAFAMVIAAGAKWKHLTISGAIAAVSAFGYMRSADYRWARVLAFLHPEEHAQGSAFQSNQALLAIGNGRFWGVGLGMSEQKNFYVPEPHTDFIFSVLSEELGFIGMFILTVIFIILIYRGFRVAKYAPDALGKMLAFGLTLLIAANFVAHTGVNLGLFPTTGIPLPFISYGGMSLIFTTTSIAILLNISSHTTFAKVKK